MTDRSAVAAPARRTLTGVGRWSGFIVLLSSGAVAVALLVPGETGTTTNSASGTLYRPLHWVLLAGLSVTGVLLADPRRMVPALHTLIGRPPAEHGRLVGSFAGPVAAAGAVLAAQLAGVGIVAAKHWHPFSGGFGYGAANLRQVEGLAVMVAGVSVLGLGACALTVARSGGFRAVSPPPLRERLAVAAVGAAVAVALPAQSLIAGGSYPTTTIGGYALLTALPWGGAIAGAAWLRRAEALSALRTVAATATLAAVAKNIFQAPHQLTSSLAVVVVAVAATYPWTRTRP